MKRKSTKQTPEDSLKLAQTAKERATIRIEKRKQVNEDDKVVIAKLEVLRCLLLGEIIDEEKTIPGIDRAYKNLFEEGEIYSLKGKIMELIKKL
jgi:hypothetical protein